jgi:bifunctional UDP-N-acetylglucosamine pyrophosphorylase/glucosamine-1-phosphate N-acetyltransferase
MKSATPKVLHEVLGRPMVWYAVDSALAAMAGRVTVVVGHGREQVEASLQSRYADAPVDTVIQHQMLGTADAVKSASATFNNHHGPVVILSGDTPNVSTQDIGALLERHRTSGALVTLMSAIDPGEHHYGRIVRDEHGEVARITEFKDASPAVRAVREVNMGLYVVEAAFLAESLARTTADNAAGEFYLTDIVSMAAAHGRAQAVIAHDIATLHGVNDRVQLAQAAAIARDRRNLDLMRSGVTLHDPATTWIHPGVQVEADAVIEPFVHLTGTTRVMSGARIGSHCSLHDCDVASGAVVSPGTNLSAAKL